MLETTIDEANNMIVVTPKDALSEADFEALGGTLDSYVNEHDRAPGLVIAAQGLPHWKNMSALMAHMKVVRDHEHVIPKVALVSDSALLSVMPTLVDVFVDAKVRHFAENDLEKAKSWVSRAEPTETSIRMIGGMPDDVIAYEVVGSLTSRDYVMVLTPLIDEKLKTHDKLKVLVVLGDSFEGATPAALWDDARLGFSHVTGFSKLAIVSDISWVRHSAKIFGPLVPAQLHVFALDELDEAKSWVRS